MNFLAIDFETANYFRDSACAVGLVRVENNKIVEKVSYIIRPPSNWFVFTYIHGLTWNDVKNEPHFGEIWEKVHPLFRNIDFLVAHNATFDKSVLKACCERYRISPPTLSFQCTMQLSRALWKIYPTDLESVCRHFRIPLKHHDALSDTIACAKIMIKALEEMRK
jgi:DNA polymerase-3 subunit epsilon